MKGSIGTPMHITKGRQLWNKAGGKCPSCNSSESPRNGVLKEREGKFGKFLGCSRYPECKYTTKFY